MFLPFQPNYCNSHYFLTARPEETLQLRARLTCRSLSERNIRGLRRAEPRGTPFCRCDKHIFTRIEAAVRHLYAFLSLVGLAPSLAASPPLRPALLSFSGQYL